jgi:valyl-tRNA synthetase
MRLDKAYEADKYERNIYELWEKNDAFKADPTSDKPRFSISMPPPNETGTLHTGHAIGITLQDLMIRHTRQKGYDALWLPGTDHAAIAVNAIMEKKLAEEGTNKHEVGREEFLKRTREFVGDSRNNMISQIRAMGASADWSRLRYTLDEALNRCVNEVFVRMYNDGLIYRGHRIVNWDPKLETTVSDDEMVYKEE